MDNKISPDRTTWLTGPKVGVAGGVTVGALGGGVAVEDNAGWLINLAVGVAVGRNILLGKVIAASDGVGAVRERLYHIARAIPPNTTTITTPRKKGRP
jgi:hypothetical protein